MESIDAIILCGGLGKRLRPAIGTRQKTMASVNGQPFLEILLKYLLQQEVERVILCTGFQAKSVEDYFRRKNWGLTIVFSREREPLGTGGAVKQARTLVRSKNFFVLNGDSLCEISYPSLLKQHERQKALATIVAAKVSASKDFGTMVIDQANRIMRFEEKSAPNPAAAYVNAGVYCFSRQIFPFFPKTKSFSLERDVFPQWPALLKNGFVGYKIKSPFHDIGTPQRYKKAQVIFKGRHPS